MFRAAGSAGLNNVCETEGILQLAEGLRFFCPFLGNPWLDPLSRRKLHAVWRQHFLHRGALRRQAADLRRRNGPAAARPADRKSVVSGTGVSVRVYLGGRRIIKKKKKQKHKR